MSFNFGNTSLFNSAATTSTFGASTSKPTTFGGFNTPTTSAPAFGFGTTTTSSGFGTFGAAGNTGFGTTTPSTGFGAPAASTGFGAPAASTGFGAPAANTGFGAPAANTGFGAPPASTGFGGFGGFGATTSTTPSFGGLTAPSTGFSFGGATSSAPSTGFSFGNTTTSTAPSGFGGFGGFGAATAGSSGSGLFGGGLGQTAGTTSSFGGFGTAKPAFNFGGSTFGQPQQQQQQQPVADPSLALYNSIFNCQVFGDERDAILGRWNLLQALWGVGKGYYNHQAPPVEYDLKNIFCRFKGIAYSARPKCENKDGQVALVINKKHTEIRPLESQIVCMLVNILGNKPNLSPTVESFRAVSDSKTVVAISVQEKSATGVVRQIPANDLAAYLLQPMQKQQLTNLQVENVYAQVELPSEQLREYLDAPPCGIDAQAWSQAQADNPSPDKLVPVPLVGFGEVRWRIKCHESEAGLQQAFLNKMEDEVAELQRKQTAIVANISEYKSRLVELQHRVLKLLILQEKSRKMGMSLLPEEEALNSRLEALSDGVNSKAFKNRLNELTECVKTLTDSNKEPQRYKMDASVISEMKQFLTVEQTGMGHVIETIQADTAELKVIKDGMHRLLQGHV